MIDESMIIRVKDCKLVLGVIIDENLIWVKY